MKIYSFLRQWLNPQLSAIVLGLWFGFLLLLIFLGLAIEGTDLRYANL